MIAFCDETYAARNVHFKSRKQKISKHNFIARCNQGRGEMLMANPPNLSLLFLCLPFDLGSLMVETKCSKTC